MKNLIAELLVKLAQKEEESKELVARGRGAGNRCDGAAATDGKTRAGGVDRQR